MILSLWCAITVQHFCLNTLLQYTDFRNVCAVFTGRFESRQRERKSINQWIIGKALLFQEQSKQTTTRRMHGGMACANTNGTQHLRVCRSDSESTEHKSAVNIFRNLSTHFPCVSVKRWWLNASRHTRALTKLLDISQSVFARIAHTLAMYSQLRWRWKIRRI